MNQERQMSQSMPLAIMLTLAGGFQDAYSYNSRGHVFANAQTGNIVLFAQNLMSAQFDQALHYLVPVLAFMIGVYVSERIHHKYKYSQMLHWRQLILFSEVCLLIIVGFIESDMAANILLSFACAMQVQSFRKFKGIMYATTMCIGNMRSATEMLCQYHISQDEEVKRKSYRYYLLILIFALGAGLGALSSWQWGNHSIWIAALFMMLGVILMFVREKKEEE